MKMTPSAPTHFASVQLLRFIAAIMVVAAHTTEAMSQRMAPFHNLEFWMTGTSGVDIFFVISGFVMAVSSRPASPDRRRNVANAIDFIKRRILRVVPLYWVYTLLKIVSVLALPALALRTTLDPEHILASFLFIPYMSPWGITQPLLPVGWTLNYEMLFYLIFAVAIALNLNRLLFCLGAFLALYLGGQLFSESTALTFYSRTILFEFAIGMLVAQLYVYRLSLFPALLMVIAGIFLIGLESETTTRLLRQGLGSGLLVLGGIHLERTLAIKRVLEKVSVLGDISYSSYLCHSFLVPASITLLAYTSLESASVVMAITLLAVIAGSFASYFYLERPMTERLKQWLFKPTASRTVPAPQPRMENP
jgi:exopolysaccharide production protein ExoZ